MAENSKIEWCDHTFNSWMGCTRISPACDHCYAATFVSNRMGKPELWNGERHRTSANNWKLPLKWNREAAASGIRRKVFCASLADAFDNQVPVEWLVDLLDLIFDTRGLDWLLLTKRPQNMTKRLRAAAEAGKGVVSGAIWRWLDEGVPPANVWLGTTVENQEEADRRIPHLLAVPAAVRFLSCEPLLGPVDLRSLRYDSGNLLPAPMRVNDGRCSINALMGRSTWPGSHYISPVIKQEAMIDGGKFWQTEGEYRRIDWIIVGGESGPNRRPMDLAWARSIRDQCAAAGTAFFGKQYDKKTPLPDDLMIRQFPEPTA